MKVRPFEQSVQAVGVAPSDARQVFAAGFSAAAASEREQRSAAG